MLTYPLTPDFEPLVEYEDGYYCPVEVYHVLHLD
jgi:hypothetical protein